MNLKKAVAKLRDKFRQALSNGCVCPVCDRPAKLRREHINGSIVRALEWVADQKGFINIQEYAPDWIKRERAYNKPKYWGLVKRIDEGGSNVQYKITKKGRKFLKGKIAIEKFKLIYNDHVFGESDELIDVHQCRQQPNYKRKATQQ